MSNDVKHGEHAERLGKFSETDMSHAARPLETRLRRHLRSFKLGDGSESHPRYDFVAQFWS
jgi:hypothetical protein